MARAKRKDEPENHAGKNVGKAPKRKRRKKARTDVSSSESSSDSSDSGVDAPKRNTSDEPSEETPDVPMRVVDDEVEDEAHEERDEEGPKRFPEKSGRIPEPLRNLHDPEAAAKFEEYYMRLITQEFGDDLNSVRQAKDFGDRSLPMLVRALKQGVNIFDAGEKRLVVGDKD